MTRLLLFAAVLVVCAARSAHAQEAWPERLLPATRDTLHRLAAAARAADVPVEPLVAKSAEGVLKGADDERIVRAVRTLVRELSEARVALGPSAGPATLTAAASALHAGVPVQTVVRLARSGANSTGRDLSFALITLADLVASRVPQELAAESIARLLERRAPLSRMEAFRSGVAQDIRAGRAPEAAVNARADAVLDDLGPPAGATRLHPRTRQPVSP